MAGMFQGSLLDLVDQAGPGPLGDSVRRRPLAHGAWVDVRPGWLAGADELFAGHERYLRAARLPRMERTGKAAHLLRFVTPGGPPTVLASCLTRPTSMTLNKKSNTLYVSELAGRIVAIPVAP